ncbi:MAG: hypothetical protein WBP83_05575 [Nitrososphaeraceae archaeon]
MQIEIESRYNLIHEKEWTGESVSIICKRYCYSRKTYYKWNKRYKQKGKLVLRLSQQFGSKHLDPWKWENSNYKPTPTIVEAAQALYQGHSVKEISRSDSGAENLVKSADAINRIIERSKKESSKSICFITGA